MAKVKRPTRPAVPDPEKSFESWAIIELFGHQRMAGLVTEQTLGGASFIRIDVPACDQVAAFSRLIGAAAIYAINPCTEDLARKAVRSFQAKPIQAFEIKALPGRMGMESEYG